MNGDRWISRMRAASRTICVVRSIVFLSVVLGTAIGVQGQTNSGAPSQVVAPDAQTELPAKWSEGVKALSGKIVTAVKSSQAISLEVKNLSSFGASDVEAIRKALASELASRGIRISVGETRVIVTLSENAGGYVWIEEIQKNGQSRVEMISVANIDEIPFSLKPTPVLQRRIVWRQRNEFLDFSSKSADPLRINTVTIFEPGSIKTYMSLFEKLMDRRVQDIPSTRGPRDLRGLLTHTKDGTTRAYVGTESCILKDSYCGESSSQDWPFPWGIEARFAGDRNYFGGFAHDVTGMPDHLAFYSLAIGINIFDHSTPIITTELDGRARLYNDSEPEIAIFANWGDEIASVNRPCGTSWEVLVSGTGDWTQPDHIQMYEISFEKASAIALGQPLEFPGPITAMWPEDDEKSVRIVSKNLETGMYEASIVAVSCSQ
jgi:hypothetical protein